MVEAVVYSDDKEEEAAVEVCVEPCCNMFLERPVYQVSIKTSGVSYYLSKLLAQFLEILGTRNRPNTMTIEPNRTRWPGINSNAVNNFCRREPAVCSMGLFYQRFDAACAALCGVLLAGDARRKKTRETRRRGLGSWLGAWGLGLL